MNVTEIKPIEVASAHRIRLAIYCRVSSDSEDQLHSFANQIRYYSTYTPNIRSMSWSTFTQTRALPEPPWKDAMK